MPEILINVDVGDLERATAFYTAAFGLVPSRRFGDAIVELTGAGSKLYLLAKAEGTPGAGNAARSYARHWTPVHLDFVVDDLDAAIARAMAAGAVQEAPARSDVWGRIAPFADPFGHGFCLVQFLNRGYDEISTPA